MKAAVAEGRDSPYHIIVKDVPTPDPRKDEVLVRVKAAGLTNIDHQMLSGSMERAAKRLFKRSEVLTGIEFSGIVETDGKKFKRGESVIAAIDYLNGVRAHAEYTVVPEQYLGHKPVSWSHVEAAGVPTGLITTIEALEKQAGIDVGHEVLVHGASGGVGVYAVQLAKYHKCNVLATSHPDNLDFISQLGADQAVDYNSDFLRDRKFNVIFDVAGRLNFNACKDALDPKGVFITTQPLKDLGGGLRAVFSAKKWAFLYVAHSGKNRMSRLLQLAQHQLVKPVIDSVYPLDNIDEAFEKYSNSSIRGRIVITMD